MPMQYKFFKIPVKSIEPCEEEVNRFLRSVKVVHVERELIDQGENSFWTLAIEYMPMTPGSSMGADSRKKPKVDYKSVLSPDDFAVFARLRDWRKRVAAEEGAPVYTIFTNEQLARIVQSGVRTPADLKKIDGIGESRITKYGEAVLGILTIAIPDTKEQGDK